MRSKKQSCSATLTTDQLDELIAIVTEGHGSGLRQREFNAAVLMLFEDIAGLEVMTATKSGQLLKTLWLRYQRSNDDLQRE